MKEQVKKQLNREKKVFSTIIHKEKKIMAKDCPDIIKVLNHQHQEKEVSKVLNENNPTIRHR